MCWCAGRQLDTRSLIWHTTACHTIYQSSPIPPSLVRAMKRACAAMCTTHTTAFVLPTALAAAAGFGDTGLDSTGIPDEEAYLHQYMDALQRRLAPRGVAVEEFLRVESNGLPANWLFFVSFAFFRVSAILQVCRNMLVVCCSFQCGRITQFDHPTSLLSPCLCRSLSPSSSLSPSLLTLIVLSLALPLSPRSLAPLSPPLSHLLRLSCFAPCWRHRACTRGRSWATPPLPMPSKLAPLRRSWLTSPGSVPRNTAPNVRIAPGSTLQPGAVAVPPPTPRHCSLLQIPGTT